MHHRIHIDHGSRKGSDPNKKERKGYMRKTKKQRFRASILALLLVVSMVLGMVPGSAGQVYAKESTSSPSEEETGFIDKAIDFFQDTGDKIASFFGAGDKASPAAALDETSIVDADTKGGWTDIVENSTQNIGLSLIHISEPTRP